MLNRRGALKLFAVAALATPGIAAGGGRTDAPRTLANGRPACGNVMGKGQSRACEPAPTTLVTAPPAEPPRVLANGRPACGNVMGKSYAGPEVACDPEPVSVLAAAPANASTPAARPASAPARPANARPAKTRSAPRARTAKAGAR